MDDDIILVKNFSSEKLLASILYNIFILLLSLHLIIIGIIYNKYLCL